MDLARRPALVYSGLVREPFDDTRLPRARAIEPFGWG